MPQNTPTPGELWADPHGDEWHVLTDADGQRWLARPVDGADLTGWTLAAEQDGAPMLTVGRA